MSAHYPQTFSLHRAPLLAGFGVVSKELLFLGNQPEGLEHVPLAEPEILLKGVKSS